jgi:hypothetical protein
VAQSGSALEWGSRGRRFESSHSDFILRDVAQPGRAHGSGP